MKIIKRKLCILDIETFYMSIMNTTFIGCPSPLRDIILMNIGSSTIV